MEALMQNRGCCHYENENAQNLNPLEMCQNREASSGTHQGQRGDQKDYAEGTQHLLPAAFPLELLQPGRAKALDSGTVYGMTQHDGKTWGAVMLLEDQNSHDDRQQQAGAPKDPANGLGNHRRT